MSIDILNKQQLEAVKCIENNSIILACPGSGKTHTVISKIFYMVEEKNINSNEIILITFTNKAAEEMKNRVELVLKEKKLKYVGTLHGLAYRILQEYENTNYTMIDEQEFIKIIEDIFLSYLNENCILLEDDIKLLLLKNIAGIYDVLSSQYPQNLREILENNKLDKYYNIVKGGIKFYNDYKAKKKILDFSDLMVKFLDFLGDEKAEEFKKSYKYVLFDEYQDINNVQNSILIKMSNDSFLTVVGDDAQSIYAFRGSNNSYILNFERNYENVKKFMLENNYRSTPEIINFCNAIIDNSYGNLNKKMIAVKESVNSKPVVRGFSKTIEEINYIINKITENYEDGIKLKDQVIITRKNKQLDAFELHLIKNGIYYIKNKGVGILERIHVKDFLSFLKILEYPNDIISWKRLLVIYLDDVNYIDDILEVLERDKRLTMKDIISGPEIYLDKHLCIKLEKLTNLYNKLYLTHMKDLGGFCNEIIKNLRYFIGKRLRIKDESYIRKKISDLICLKNYILKLKSLKYFFEIMSSDNKKIGDENDHLLLSTIHGSKGLEWDYVFLSGCSSDMVPSMRSAIFKEELESFEEERRLFYVGCSRAKRYLEITLSYDYHFISNYVYTSPFISCIPGELYKKKNVMFLKKMRLGDITKIINNYLFLRGTHDLYPYLNTIEYEKKTYYNSFDSDYIYKNKLEMLYGTFIDNLICKMVYYKHKDSIGKINVPIYERNKLRHDKNYNNYIDPNNDWKDKYTLRSILNISKIDGPSDCNYKYLFNYLSSKKSMELYDNIDKMIEEIVDDSLSSSVGKNFCPNNKVNLHYNLTFGNIKGEADLVVGRTLIEIKTSRDEISTVRNVLQTIMYRYMLRTKNIRIDNIILVNPLLGETYTLKITPKWKDTFRVYNTVLS